VTPILWARRTAFHSRFARGLLVRWRYRALRPSDALVVSYPRSGTTWVRFLVAHALTGESPGFDPATHPVQYLGKQRGAPPLLADDGRVLYSHETRDVGPRRVIYVVRDPRSVALSEYRWLLRRRMIDPGLDAFIDRFVEGRSNPWGAWDAHVETWHASPAARAGSLHVVRYRDLRSDTVQALDAITRDLGVHIDRDRLETAVAANTLAEMRQKELEAPDRAFARSIRRDVPFIATGKVSGWTDELSTDHVRAIVEAFGPTMTRVGFDTGIPAE
jgi:hypothetical protein